MGRPIFIYRAAELRQMPVLNSTENWTLRIDQPTFRVWLSVDEQTVRVDEKAPYGGNWQQAEKYKAR